jgi:hypothetical protein
LTPFSKILPSLISWCIFVLIFCHASRSIHI